MRPRQMKRSWLGGGVHQHGVAKTHCQDAGTFLEASTHVALHAAKGMSWKWALASGDRGKAIAALEKELSSLEGYLVIHAHLHEPQINSAAFRPSRKAAHALARSKTTNQRGKQATQSPPGPSRVLQWDSLKFIVSSNASMGECWPMPVRFRV